MAASRPTSPRPSPTSVIEAILVGAATVGTLLLLVFPPTTALGLASAGRSPCTGSPRRMRAVRDRRHACPRIGSDALDPEQQEAAHGLMAMGLIRHGAQRSRSRRARRRLRTSHPVRVGSRERVLDGLDAVTDRYDVAIRNIRFRLAIGHASPSGPAVQSSSTVRFDLLDERPALLSTPPRRASTCVRLQELRLQQVHGPRRRRSGQGRSRPLQPS